MAKAKKVVEKVGSSKIMQAVLGVRRLILEPNEVEIASQMGYHANQQLPEQVAIKVASEIGTQAALLRKTTSGNGSCQ